MCCPCSEAHKLLVLSLVFFLLRSYCGHSNFSTFDKSESHHTFMQIVGCDSWHKLDHVHTVAYYLLCLLHFQLCLKLLRENGGHKHACSSATIISPIALFQWKNV